MRTEAMISYSLSGAALFAGVAINFYWRKYRVDEEKESAAAAKKRAIAIAAKHTQLWNSTIFFPSRPYVPVENARSSMSKLGRYLNSARRCIKISVMSISGRHGRHLVDLLIEKHKSGILIQVYTATGRTTMKNAKRFRKNGIQVHHKEYAYSTTIHHKFIIIDDYCVLTGSLNWSVEALEHQHENLVIVDDPRIVPKYCERFDYLWSIYDEDCDQFNANSD